MARLKKKRYYPVGLDIRGQRCVIVGSGNVARRKIERLLLFGAKVVVVNPYRKTCLKGAYLVFACTDKLGLNRRIAKDAKELGILVNVAKPGNTGSFILPAIAEKGDFLVSVSTHGRSPAEAKRLCEKIAAA